MARTACKNKMRGQRAGDQRTAPLLAMETEELERRPSSPVAGWPTTGRSLHFINVTHPYRPGPTVNRAASTDADTRCRELLACGHISPRRASFAAVSPVEHPVEPANGGQRFDRFEPVTRLSERRGFRTKTHPSGFEPDEAAGQGLSGGAAGC